MSEKLKPENKDVARKIELRIVEPRGDKNFMIGFEGKTKKECLAYNYAIETVLKRANLDPFHQVGVSSGQHEPGYHAWEIWQKATREDLETLLAEIEKEAQSMLAE
ncbi:hypothetical protein HYW17_06000 [Candidatus Uhrbacteria bacterium]|nr:hypothetical protein [Candidatus Uhrbacteria bacterium]